MAKEVTLKIKVQDGEVVTATSSINRLEKAASNLGPATKGISMLESGLSALGGPAGIASAAISALGAGALAAGKALFDLAVSSSDFGSKIFDASQKTGLGAEALSAMHQAAQESGTSLDAITAALGRFSKTIGDAANGSDKAAAKLKQFGIEPLSAINDLEGSLGKVFNRIMQLPPGIQQITAAQDAFGRSGQDLLPFIKSFDGDLDALTKRMKELGVTITDDNARAADAFGDQLDQLKAQLAGVGRTIGFEVMPVFKEWASETSSWLVSNKGEVRAWAEDIVDAIRRAVASVKQFGYEIKYISDYLNPDKTDEDVQRTYTESVRLQNIAAGTSIRGPWSSTEDEYAMFKQGKLPYSFKSPFGDDTATGGKKKTVKDIFTLSSQGQALVQAAEKLGISPLDLATIISFETGGTFSPSKVGGAGNKYRGLIQFGPQEREDYGVTKGQSFEDQITTSVVKFFQDRFGKAGRTTEGASLLDLYTTVLAGNPNANPDAKDSFGTSARSGVAKMVRDHRDKAMDRFFGGSAGNIPKFDADDIQKMLGQRSETLTKADRDKLLQSSLDMYLQTGLIPDKKLVDQFRSLIVEENKKSGEIQVTAEEVLQAFRENAAAKAGERGFVSSEGPGISSQIETRKTLDQQYIANVRESLQIEQRRTLLIFQQRNLQAEINEEIESYNLSLDEAASAAEKEYQILLKRNLAAEAGNDAAFERNALTREIGDLEKAIANTGVNDSLILQAEYLRTVLDLRNRELDAVISIQRSQLELSQSMVISGNQIRAQVYEHLAGQRTLNDAIADGINKTYDELGARLDDQIDKMFEWAGAFKSLFAEPFKAIARNGLTNITKGLLDAIMPGLGGELTKTNNPIARPIVDKLDDTNKLLAQLVRSTGGVPAAGGGGLSGLLGGLLGGGTGPGGTGVFNPGYFSGSLGGASAPLMMPSGQPGGGGILSRITGPGGIFGSQGFGNNVGTYGAFGVGAGMLGGLIGGRVGGVISGAGAGLAIGAQIGSIVPGIGTAIGAVVGAIAGGLLGLFGGDPKRKRDKEEKIPALNKGFTDAFAELRKILEDIRFLRVDPDEAVSRANEVRAQIAGGFGIQFESKKYRKQAQATIAGKLGEADGIIAEIKAAAGIARGAADRRQRILPEFAGGVFLPNGLLPGVFDGRDNIFAMISRGEMVLNPNQQGRVRSIAGFDVFAGAGIPNYPSPSGSPKLATGGIAGAGLALAAPNVVVQPSFTLYIDGVVMDDRIGAYMESDTGQRTQVKVIKRMKQERLIT